MLLTHPSRVTALKRVTHLPKSSTARYSSHRYNRFQTFATVVESSGSSSNALDMVAQSPLQGGKPQDYGNFKLLKSLDIDYAPVSLAKWKSEKTGLTVVVGSHASPVVSFLPLARGDCSSWNIQTSGHFAIASESMLNHRNIQSNPY
jgi:hypothetical protein